MSCLAARLSALRLACGALAWVGFYLPAQAQQLWGYVDGAGVAHFADSAVDSRYLPVLPEPASADMRSTIPGMSGLKTSCCRPKAKRHRSLVAST